MNPPEDPSDRLVDSLLREQSRNAADEELMNDVRARLARASRESMAADRSRRWASSLLAIAALVVLGTAFLFWRNATTTPEQAEIESDVEILAYSTAEAMPAPELALNDLRTEPPAVAMPKRLNEGSESLRALPPVSKGVFARFGLAQDFGEGWAADTSAHPNDGHAIAGDRENYGRLVDQPWKSPWRDALSTFSVDVDTASYTNVRRTILEGRPLQADAVRIEELINYFDYGYEGPQGDGPFAAHSLAATCPWEPKHLLARIALKGREVEVANRPAANLVFLIDVSGSMQSPDKLPLVKRSLRLLIDRLDERDRLSMVVYAGSEGVALEPTVLDERGKAVAIAALEKLEAGGSTNGGAGIHRAYALAGEHLVKGGINRVILASDGDFNVGTTGQGELVELVKKGAKTGVSLSVLGFGTGNLNDAMLEAVTNEGNGNYFYIDNESEARRVFLQKLTGTLVTIAKDVKIQVEFNPAKVQAYRLIGYANRILRDEDFSDDKVDAGDIGAGHTVTAFYEIVPVGVPAPDTGDVDPLRYQRPVDQEAVPSDDWFTLKLRHKHPEGSESVLTESVLEGEPVEWNAADDDFRFASAVALFGMKLRGMPEVADLPWAKVEEMIEPTLAKDPREQRGEFLELVRKAKERDL